MKLFDKLLFAYSTLFALILTISGLFSGMSGTNIILIILFLPVTLYLAYQIIKSLYRLKYSSSDNHPTPTTKPTLKKSLIQNGLPLSSDKFDLKLFFSQNDPKFLITLTLYSLALTGTILKAALEIWSQTPFLSPLPSS